MQTWTSLLSEGLWICDLQYGIVCEDQPEVQTTTPTAAAVSGIEVVAPEPEPDLSSTTASEAPKEDWRERRLAQTTAKNKALQDEIDRLKREKEAQPLANGQASEAEIEARVATRASALAAKQEFDRRCTATANDGRVKFPDFDAKVSSLMKVVDSADETSVIRYNQMLDVAIETGKGPEILHLLGSDLNEASRILALPATRMAVELTKLAGNDKAMTAVGKPVQVIEGSGRSQGSIDPTDKTRSDQLDTATWMQRRMAQKAAQATSGR